MRVEIEGLIEFRSMKVTVGKRAEESFNVAGWFNAVLLLCAGVASEAMFWATRPGMKVCSQKSQNSSLRMF